MLTPKQQPTLQPGTKPLQRRFSRIYSQALSSNQEAEQLRSDVEASSLFNELLTKGIIRKAHLGGIIPQDQYLNYRLKEAIASIDGYGLESQPEWSEALRRGRTEEYLNQLAEKWRVPKGQLRRLLRLFGAQSGETGRILSEIPFSQDQLASKASTLDFGDTIETIARFVDRYGLSRQDFVDHILSGNCDSSQIVVRFGCRRAEAEAVLNSVSRLGIIEAFNSEIALQQSGLRSTPASVAGDIMAEAYIEPDGRIQVRLLNKYASAIYLINHDRLKDWENMHGVSDTLRSLLEAIQALNERSGTLTSIARVICSAQSSFIVSGELSDLRPFSQSELARCLKLHRSVISRLVRGQRMLIAQRPYALTDLLPRNKAVISRLLDIYPQWTDSQIAKYFERQFDVHISQRAVNYHRNALARETAHKIR